MINIALVDDHEIVRGGVAELLHHEVDIQVVYECGSVREQMDWIQEHDADVLVVDLSLHNESGYDLLDLLNDTADAPQIIVLSMHDKDPYITKAIEKGAKGYVSKRSSPDELISAIKTVMSDQNFLCPAVMRNLKFKFTDKQLNAIKLLTQRERDVFDCLALGMEVKRIAQKLDIATKTVHAHRNNLMSKLVVHTNIEITKMALKCGLLTIEDLIQ